MALRIISLGPFGMDLSGPQAGKDEKTPGEEARLHPVFCCEPEDRPCEKRALGSCFIGDGYYPFTIAFSGALFLISILIFTLVCFFYRSNTVFKEQICEI